MKVIRELADFPVLTQAVVTSGTFDGVHLGHQKIIDRLLEITRATNGQSVVVTYWPHPRLVLQSQNQSSLQLLSTIDERIEQLSVYPIDYLLIIPFTRDFARSRQLKGLQPCRRFDSEVFIYLYRFGARAMLFPWQSIDF